MEEAILLDVMEENLTAKSIAQFETNQDFSLPISIKASNITFPVSTGGEEEDSYDKSTLNNGKKQKNPFQSDNRASI